MLLTTIIFTFVSYKCLSKGIGMKLSVIVPVYKVRRYLQNCIESILQQTFTDLELILVDDGSPDQCGAICDRYAQENSRIKVIHKANGGLSSARNAGLAVAQGEYITFVDGDDMIAPETYINNMKILLNDPSIDMLEYPIVVHYESPSSYMISFTPEKVSGNKHIFTNWIKDRGYTHCYACNKIYKADLFFFMRYPTGEAYEDLAVTPYLIENCDNIYYSEKGIYYYYKHNESITTHYTFKSQKELFENNAKLYHKVKNEYELTDESNEMLLHCVNTLIDVFRCKDFDKKYRKRAFELLKKDTIDASTLFHMNVPARTKIKNLVLALCGLPFHCFFYSMIKKKLS